MTGKTKAVDGNGDHQDLIRQTRQWLEQVVIGHHFCPFAKRELLAGKVRFQVLSGQKTASLLEELGREWYMLDQHAEVETTLLIFADALRGFEQYLDFLELAQQLLEDQDYEGVYQLASFHPDYQFADCEFADPANFTNRSPWPVLHILRESSVEKAIESYADVEQVPERNMALAREKGGAYWEALLRDIAQVYSESP